MSLATTLIWIGIILAFISLLVLLIAKQYKKVGPNEVLIISGGHKRSVTEPDGTKRKIGYRYRLGGGAFVWPFLETYDILPIDVINLSLGGASPDADLEAALSEDLDLAAALQGKISQYQTLTPKASKRSHRVVVDNTSSSFFTIIEIFTYDFKNKSCHEVMQKISRDTAVR